MREMEMFRRPKGDIKMFLHKGGMWLPDKQKMSDDTKIIKYQEDKNLVVSSASILMASRMAPGSLPGTNNIGDGDYVKADFGIKYLALGDGVGPGGTFMAPIQPTLDMTRLGNETARKEFESWYFLTYDNATNKYMRVSDPESPTNILELTSVFYETEAIGSITEMGLFGGTDATTASNSGMMFNIKRFPVWNKPSDTVLTIIWRITF